MHRDEAPAEHAGLAARSTSHSVALGATFGAWAPSSPLPMGKRSRNRAGGTVRDRPAPAAPRRKGLDPVRRVLAGYLIVASLVGVLTLVGIALLGGSLGPFVVLAAVVVVAGLVSRAVTRRLAGVSLTDEDRVIQTMAGGMLVISVILSLSSAVLSVIV